MLQKVERSKMLHKEKFMTSNKILRLCFAFVFDTLFKRISYKK